MTRTRMAIVAALLLMFAIDRSAVKTNAAPRRPASAAGHARPVMYRPAPATASAATYTLMDDGVPTSSTYSLSYAVAFNNTGQIAGEAFFNEVLPPYGVLCVLFDGKKYRELSSSANITSCYVDGMNDQDAVSGALDVAGYASTTFSFGNSYPYAYYGDPKAVYSTIVPRTGSIRTTVFPEDQSYLVGVNNAGTAVGLGVYRPRTGFATLDPPFVTKAGSALNVVQPTCSTVRLGCAGFPAFGSGQPQGCGFGGCQITSDGKLFLIDLFTGSYELVSPDGTTQDIELGADVVPNIYDIGAPSINGAGQILYTSQTVVAGVLKLAPRIYQLGGAVVTVPPIAGKSCTQYIPLSFSNTGEVLGVAYDCGTDNTYFTYDTVHGTQDLTPALPTSGFFTLSPIGVNDKGQILVDFELSSGGAVHWGVLSPPRVSARGQAGKRNVTTASRAKTVAFLPPVSRASTRRFPTVILPSPKRSRASRNSELRLFGPASPPLHLRKRSVLAPAPAYSIVDYGAPAQASYSLGNPVAFNNTGQVVGTATDLPYTQSSTCILFDGSRFRNISSSPTVDNCNPMSIDDKSASTGNVVVVGNVVSAFSYGSGVYEPGQDTVDVKAFVSRIVPATGTVNTTIFAANDISDLTSVNASGLAIGVGAYALSQNFSAPAFYVAPGMNSLHVLQPSCTTQTATCDGYNQQIPCAFGACSLTDDGTIFLNNVIIAPDGTAQPFKLPDFDPYRPIINNAKQLLYRDIPRGFARPSVPIYYSQVRLYQIGTGQETKIPKITGNTCDGYVPLSFNNAGTVIGLVGQCPATTPDTYFIYDAINGTRDLMALLPSGDGAIVPIGINDNGQILISLTQSDGTIHWGILAPTVANGGRRTNSHARLH